MSKTNEWGDKVIIYLHSDGIRRHKNWCINHRKEDNFCSILCGKCIGSAFCDNYKSIYPETSPFLLVDPAVKQKTNTNAEKQSKSSFWGEVYRRAKRGEHLTDKTVLIHNTPYSFRFGEVVEDSFDYVSVKFDGRIHKYEKKPMFRNDGIYVYEETGCYMCSLANNT